MTIKRFEDIEAWQLARQLTKEVYFETRKQPLRRDWRFCSQIQSAAVSIMSNIAEGYLAQTDKEFIRFSRNIWKHQGEDVGRLDGETV